MIDKNITVGKILSLCLVFILTSCYHPEPSAPSARGGGSPSAHIAWAAWPSSVLDSGIALVISDEVFNDIPPELNGAEYNKIEKIMKVWDDQIPGKTFFQYGLAQVPNKDLPNISHYYQGAEGNEIGIYYSHSWFSNVSSQALGVAQLIGQARKAANSQYYMEIQHADIILNNTFDFRWLETQSGYDLESIIMHEIGHLLGLGHSGSSTNAVMAPSISLDTEYRGLKAWDIEAIEDLYLNKHALQASLIHQLSSDQSQADSSAPHIQEGDKLRLLIELTTEGDCNHYLNGELIYSHAR